MGAVLEIALPVFAIILTGYLSGRAGLLGAPSSEALNRFVFFFALPPVLFISTARAPLAEVLNWGFIAAFLGGGLGTAALSMLAGRVMFGVRQPALTVQAVGAAFPNVGYMGIPLFLAAFGPEGVLPAIVSTVFGTLVSIGGSVTVIELYRAAGGSTLRILRDVAGALLRNPLLVAPVLGIAASFAGFAVPKPLANYLDLMGAAAGPAALFALGLSLVGRKLSAHMLEVSWLTVLKLFFQPALTMYLAYRVFELDPHWADSAVILAALPTAALVFVVAQRYDVYLQRASAVILLTTAVSVVTLSALLVILGVG